MKETKALVEPIMLNVAYGKNSMVMSWGTEAGNLVLESTTSLGEPVNWTPVEGDKETSSGRVSMTVPIGTGTKYFRLRLQSP